MIVLANSSLCCKYIDDVVDIANENPYRAVEWDMNFIPPTLSQKRIVELKRRILDNHLDIRFHLPYSYIELAHENCEIRNYSILTLKQYISFIENISNGIAYAILHVGYYEGSRCSIAIQSLSELVDYAMMHNVILCIENLINGLTSDLCFLQDALQIDHLFLCLDTGHADVVAKETTSEKFFSDLISLLDKCIHAHVYKTENSFYNHLPFCCVEEIQTSRLTSLLLKSKCNWYTMELDSKIEQTTQMKFFQSLMRF